MWKSKGFPDEIIKPTVASNNSLAPAVNLIYTRLRVQFDGPI